LTLADAKDTQLDRWLCQAFAAQPHNAACTPLVMRSVARRWARRSEDRKDVSLGHALRAICLLLRDPAPEADRAEARSLLDQIGWRALRSVHVATLTAVWLQSREGWNHRRLDGLWRRLNVDVKKNLKSPRGLDNVLAVHRFCQAVQLRNRKNSSAAELLPLADALLATIGQFSPGETWRTTRPG
jgi:hypothetical protein